MNVRLDVIQYLQNKLALTPLRVPHRLELITSQLKNYVDDCVKDNIYVFLDIELPGNESFFQPTLENVACVSKYIPRHALDYYHLSSGVVILLPDSTSCCSRKFRLDPRHSLVKLYTLKGVSFAYYYHGRCTGCKKSFYYNFSENSDQNRIFDEICDKEYFVIASGIGFSIEFLEQVSLQVSIGCVGFEKICEMYNYGHKLFGTNDLLRKDILENNWILFRLISKIKVINWNRKITDCTVHTEKICMEVYPILKNAIDSRWLEHKCNEIGCQSRFIVCDGNEKLYRYCCSEPIEKVFGAKGEVNFSRRCINNPKRGNQNIQSSKKCHFHSTGKKNNTTTLEQLDLKPITRSHTKSLEMKFISSEGCKEEKNLNKFEERTAGMFYLFRPCGIRVSHFEMYTAESLSMVFTSFVDVFGKQPLKSVLSGIVYDRACDLLPYLERLSVEGNEIAKHFVNLRFIVDIFHCEKHTQPKCVLKSGVCKFHPDLEVFSDVRAMNMEVGEQSFHVLNSLKHITRNMTYAKRLCFLKIIDDDFNVRLELKSQLP